MYRIIGRNDIVYRYWPPVYSTGVLGQDATVITTGTDRIPATFEDLGDTCEK